MHKLIDFICDEMDELERKASKDGKLSMAEVQYLDTLAHTKKNLLKAEEMSDGEYSGRMYPRYYGDMDERSYARRRDSRGRYSSRGYSMANEDMIDELHGLMEKAPDEHTKKEFKKFIEKIEMM